jgi:site-specific DNA recombinase
VVQLSLTSNNEREAPDQQTATTHKAADDQGQSGGHSSRNHANARLLVIPWKKPPSKIAREIIPPGATSSRRDSRPIRAETRAKLLVAIAKGRRWLDELIAGKFTNVEQIAAADSCTTRQVNMTISLAFLAPALTQAAVDGRLPRGIGVAALRDAPAEWTKQHAMLGLAY